VRDEHDGSAFLLDGRRECDKPVGSIGVLPIGLFRARVAVPELPERLPVERTGAPEPWNDHDFDRHDDGVS
jgi:hypothetical protein